MKTPPLPAHETAARQRRAATETPRAGSNEQTTWKRTKPPAPVEPQPNRSADGRFKRKLRSA